MREQAMELVDIIFEENKEYLREVKVRRILESEEFMVLLRESRINLTLNYVQRMLMHAQYA